MNTYPDTILMFHVSNSVIHIHSNASYLCESKARIRTGGNLFIGAKTGDNGKVLNIDQIIKNVISFAPKATIGSFFLHSGHTVLKRTILGKMGHTQPPYTSPYGQNNSLWLCINRNYNQT